MVGLAAAKFAALSGSRGKGRCRSERLPARAGHDAVHARAAQRRLRSPAPLQRLHRHIPTMSIRLSIRSTVRKPA